jgi:hypothetical protein
VLASPRFAGKQFILCGHSLGGAVAAIVTTEILMERQKQGNNGLVAPGGDSVVCLTFGSPLFGDDAARRFLTENQFAAAMFHFVVERDPVPSLLSFAQSVVAAKRQLDNQIRSSQAGTAKYLLPRSRDWHYYFEI